MAFNVVNTSAPQYDCIFTTANPCIVTVTDYSASFMSVGAAKLQSRIFQGQTGSTAAGRWCYEYRIDLTLVAGHHIHSLR